MRNFRKLAEIQEKRIAQQTRKLKGGSRTTINSGAFKTDPADVSLQDYLIDAKTVVNEQMTQTLDRRWFTKVKQEAFSKNKKGGLIAFDFGCGLDYVAGELSMWSELISDRDELESKLKEIKEIVDLEIKTGNKEEVIKNLYQLLNML